MKTTLIRDLHMALHLHDAEVLSTTDEGYGYVKARVARDGIQQYLGWEVSSAHFDYDQIVNVFREAAEVGSPEALVSYNNKPLTIEHPYEGVTIENWGDLAVGNCSNDAELTEIAGVSYVEVTLWIMHKDAVAAIRAGKTELSVGYICDVEIVTGLYTAPNGTTTEYQAVQRNIRANHVALVDRGRAGAECAIQTDARTPIKWRIYDAVANPVITPVEADNNSVQQKDNPMKTDTLRALKIGDATIKMDEALADSVEKAVDALTTAHDAAITKANTDHETALGLKDADITKLKDELKTLQDTVDAYTAKRDAAELKTVIDSATSLGLKLADNATMKDAKLSVIKHRMPDSAYTDETPIETVNAVYDALQTTAVKTPVKDSLTDVIAGAPTSDARQAHRDSLVNARKPKGA